MEGGQVGRGDVVSIEPREQFLTLLSNFMHIVCPLWASTLHNRVLAPSLRTLWAPHAVVLWSLLSSGRNRQ